MTGGGEDSKSRGCPCGIQTQFHRGILGKIIPMILSGDPKHLPQDLILYPFSGFPSLRGVRDEAIQDSLGKSIKLSGIFFIEPRCRISWTATGLSRKKILRGDGEGETATSTHRNEFPRGDGRGLLPNSVIITQFPDFREKIWKFHYEHEFGSSPNNSPKIPILNKKINIDFFVEY